MPTTLIDALLQAVHARPGDVPLRLHVAELLIDAGRGPEAVQHCAIVLQQDPGSARAHALMTRALGATPQPERTQAPADAGGKDFNWSLAEQQFSDGPSPMFVTDDAPAGPAGAEQDVERISDGAGEPVPPEDVWEVERAGVTLADVGGMHHVKERLEVSFLAPMRNPELRQLYGKSLRGGLLLYGPPGCGKTYIARAIAGEMGAGFINVTLSDVLNMYVGKSESNLHDIFQLARRSAPAVLFLDEIDAIGHKRTQSAFSTLRNVVNQLLQELDGVGSDNDGVFVLAATNTPWDVDPALRRPGRLDRSVLVLPPDEPARAAILQHNLSRRPVEGINLAKLARDTHGFTGADLSHLCESAAELAMMDSVRSGKARMIRMKDLTTSLKQLRPSARPWFDMARNVVTYADPSGEYAELRAYMKQNRLL
ncbi:MAG: AAA family ATPase [Propionibacteriaceae bacterium]|nr:AAA family ATPase [Propionibacteriaceae bacterium]